MDRVFEARIRIEAPLQRVWDFHERPDALERLSPAFPPVQVRVPGYSLAVGTEVVLRVWLGVIPWTWVARHTAYEPPHRFVDEQISGPFARWTHEHLLEADGPEATWLTDRVTYRAPFGWLGALFGEIPIQLMLHQMFTHRHTVTKRICETGQ
ncbi:MAG: SRPBCC family protein [bacterium]|nr:SRPBCC family protein [bacterium]